jgi:phenol hydroxylase P0 protein
MSQAVETNSTQKYVRVTGCRSGGLIEFDFAVGSPDLFVELILPEAALAEFCRRHEVLLLPSGSQQAGGDDALGWRLRDATLWASGGR